MPQSSSSDFSHRIECSHKLNRDYRDSLSITLSNLFFYGIQQNLTHKSLFVPIELVIKSIVCIAINVLLSLAMCVVQYYKIPPSRSRS